MLHHTLLLPPRLPQLHTPVGTHSADYRSFSVLLMSAKDVDFFTEAAETFVLSSELPSGVTGAWTKRPAVRQTAA